ncbi:cupin domain-containing protein [Maritimibacter sp. UBA3975]|uniref:cupin domain-containing protein n=1 Tax=Maritimibacter sp. UBA3975 TaxID=1946833 RepID=UPI000C0946DC|nr:cupin domain-containing protein [Maritimibacter sp. UBA3975]MAM60521.1 cupin [Maritimibacter sp.]
MAYPHFIDAFPTLDIPFPEDVVEARAIRSDAGLFVFFSFHKDFEIPEHSHKAQWGTLVAGEIEMTIDGETRTFGPGDSWDLPSGVPHSARIKAGTVAVDVFEEADRYPIKP